jgi:hypothetical protein
MPVPERSIEQSPAPPADVLKPLRWRAGIAAIAWTLSLVLLVAEQLLGVIHPPPLVYLVLLVVTVGAAVGGIIRGMWRVLRGPKRLRALAWAAAAGVPTVFWAGLFGYALWSWQTRNVPNTWPLIVTKRAAVSLMEDQANFLYPRRLETERLVMYYDDRVAFPEGDLRAMDRHVARMEEKLGLRLRARIYWVRGSLLGQGRLSLVGLALGSDESLAGYVDAHELAHALINQHLGPTQMPPTLLAEGWAESMSVPRRVLAARALNLRRLLEQAGKVQEGDGGTDAAPFADREGFERLLAKARTPEGIGSYLRELTDPFWYGHDRGPVYPIGGAFVGFLLRRYGPERFVALYFSCRPGTFAEDCRRVLDTDLDTLEKDFWEEVERLARPPTESRKPVQ